MTNTTTVIGKILAKKSLKNSGLGNPNWELIIEVDGSTWFYRTQTNGSVGYSVSNFKDGSIVEIELNSSRRIVSMKEAVSMPTPTRECTGNDVCLGGKTGLFCGNCLLPIINYRHATAEEFKKLEEGN